MWPLPFTINIKKPLDESQVCLLLLPYSLALTTTALASPREAIGWWREGGREGGREEKARKGEEEKNERRASFPLSLTLCIISPSHRISAVLLLLVVAVCLVLFHPSVCNNKKQIHYSLLLQHNGRGILVCIQLALHPFSISTLVHLWYIGDDILLRHVRL